MHCMVFGMIATYLAQLDAAATAAGVTLAEACKEEGIALTTLQRWRKPEAEGGTTPREGTAIALFNRIELMRKNKRKGRAA